MKAKLIVEGKEIEVEVSDAELQKLVTAQSNTKRTGYERVEKGCTYYYQDCDGKIEFDHDSYIKVDDSFYEAANYYSDRTVAENNARADELMRQLRRFAVEHRMNKINWNDETQCKYYIYNDGGVNNVKSDDCYVTKIFGSIYFDTKESADLAIEKFNDELIWYFTEYKDGL